MLLSTPDLDEFIRLADLDLSEAQTADLLEMLHLQPTGKWRWPTWTVTDGSVEPVAARALIGLLLLDENVLWTAQERPALRYAFRRLEAIVNHIPDTAVKIRHANGEEAIERLDTGKRIQFVCTRYPGAARGSSCDLLIVGDRITDQVCSDVLPSMATCPNPQIIYG